MDSDNDCLIIRKVVRRDDVKWPRPRPAQHKPAGVRLVLRIRLELFPVLEGVAYVVDGHVSLKHLPHSMDSEYELGHSAHLTLRWLILAHGGYRATATAG